MSGEVKTGVRCLAVVVSRRNEAVGREYIDDVEAAGVGGEHLTCGSGDVVTGELGRFGLVEGFMHVAGEHEIDAGCTEMESDGFAVLQAQFGIGTGRRIAQGVVEGGDSQQCVGVYVKEAEGAIQLSAVDVAFGEASSAFAVPIGVQAEDGHVEISELTVLLGGK